MSWLFSRVLVEEYWGEFFWDGGQSAPSNGTNTPQAFLYSDKTTDTWNPSRFGVTCEPLTDARGEDVLTWYLEGFPVKTSRSLELEKELMESDQGYGERCGASFAKFDPVSCSWKTRQLLLVGGLELFSGIWPRWGLMRRGECLERQRSEHPTKEIVCGLWLPTPTVNDSKNNGSQSQKDRNSPNLNAVVGGKLSPPWVAWVMGWPEGWTDCAPLETDKYRQWLHLHFEHSGQG